MMLKAGTESVYTIGAKIVYAMRKDIFVIIFPFNRFCDRKLISIKPQHWLSLI